MKLNSVSDLSLELGLALLEAGRRDAEQRGLRLAMAIVDRGGNPVATQRMDGCQLGASSLAFDKAVTAVSFQHPTSAWSESSAPGGSDWGLAGTLGGRAIVFPGGVPVFAGSELVGAIGVSGAASRVDEAVANAALTALALRSSAS